MTAGDFEHTLRDRMRAQAAQLDRSLKPAPPLAELLERAPAHRPSGIGRPGPGFSPTAFALAGATVGAVVAIAMFSGVLLLNGLPGTTPLSSVAPSPSPTLASFSPSPSVSLTVSPAGRTSSPASLTGSAFWPLAAPPSELDGQGR